MHNTALVNRTAAPVHRTAHQQTWCSACSIRTRPVPACDPSHSPVSRDTTPVCIGCTGAGLIRKTETELQTAAEGAVFGYFDTSLTVNPVTFHAAITFFYICRHAQNKHARMRETKLIC